MQIAQGTLFFGGIVVVIAGHEAIGGLMWVALVASLMYDNN